MMSCLSKLVCDGKDISR